MHTFSEPDSLGSGDAEPNLGNTSVAFSLADCSDLLVFSEPNCDPLDNIVAVANGDGNSHAFDDAQPVPHSDSSSYTLDISYCFPEPDPPANSLDDADTIP